MSIDLAQAPAEAEAEPGEAEPTQLVLPALSFTGRDRLTKGIRKRRSVPIMGYTGTNGMGKTLCMVRDTLPSLALGRPILSTVKLLDPHTGNPHPLWVPFQSFEQLHEFTNGDVLMDEITGIMDSRDGNNAMPRDIRRLLPQMRRRNVMIRWTGIDWDNTERRLRQMTQAVAMCRGYVPNHAAVRSDGQRDVLAMWAPNRVFSAVTYDAQRLSQSDDSAQLSQEESKKKKAKVLNREWFVGTGSLAFRCYNTLDSVLGVDNGRICSVHGHRIREQTCAEDHGAGVQFDDR